MYKHIAKISLVASMVVGAGAAVAGQEEEPIYDENTRDCIDLRRVRRTEVIDDRNVLFYMAGSTVYHNILPRQCGGLARQDRFSYKTSIGRLCRIDYISVLYDDPVTGLREGNRCSLGVFHKITKEDAAAFKDDSGRGPAANPLPMPEPEEVDDQPEEDDPGSR